MSQGQVLPLSLLQVATPSQQVLLLLRQVDVLDGSGRPGRVARLSGTEEVGQIVWDVDVVDGPKRDAPIGLCT